MNKHLLATAILAALLTLSGCAEEPAQQNSQQQQLQPIDVATVVTKPVQSWHTYTTRLEAPEEVSLMPRVSGVIENIAFEEGDAVKKGDLLFELDARPHAANVASLKAQVTSAQAALEQARSEAKRAERLTQRKAISIEQAESRTSTLHQRQAQLTAYEAQLTAAELDLAFTQIRSPIDGIISRANITKGNNVQAGHSVLTSIVSNKTMYAYFDVDKRTWNRSFSDVTRKDKQAVVMQKVGEEAFDHAGYIDFIDNQINVATGTLRVRARFEQSQNELRAGSFARIKLAANVVQEHIIVPDRAIGTDLKNRFVLTIGENNILQYKLVTVGERYGRFRVITSGLSDSDIIAVNGPARVGPGMPVAPNTVTLDTSGIAFTLQPSSHNLMAKK
jgi:multidrug efflux system membrane fusion protein